MSKKLMVIGTAVALMFALAIVVVAGNSAFACDKEAQASAASASTCSKSASAASVASSSCCMGASASVASSSGCTRSASYASASCCDGKAAVAGYTKTGDKKACSKETAEEHAAAIAKITDEIPYRADKRLVLTGTMQCGQCSYEATASCAPLLKTVDGKVYPLAPGQILTKMKKTEAADGFEVTTRVKKIDGVKYLDVVAFKAL